jgi:hypothetical protein
VPGSTDASGEAHFLPGQAETYSQMGGNIVPKDRKPKLWIYQDPSVRLPYCLIHSEAWKRLPPVAIVVYILMRASAFNGGPTANNDPARIRFGPADTDGYISREGHYSGVKALIDTGIIEEIAPGYHGRKASYNLLTLNWVDQ